MQSANILVYFFWFKFNYRSKWVIDELKKIFKTLLGDNLGVCAENWTVLPIGNFGIKPEKVKKFTNIHL